MLLTKKQLYVTNTVMKIWVAATLQKLHTDKTMKKHERGTSAQVTTEDGNICIIKWYDNEPVLKMSAVHAREPEDKCQRRGKKTEIICDHLATKYCLWIQLQDG